jgi:nucleoside-diphosphate-sugar epimerase
MGVVLVTGGTGFLGSSLVRSLAERGEAVRVFSRRPAALADGAVEMCGGDILDEAAVDRAVAGAEVVIHLASSSRLHTGRQSRAVNVEGTRRLLAAARRNGVVQVIYCSSIGVHGDVRGIPADESAPFAPGDDYQSAKLEAEHLVRDWAGSSGIPATILRPAAIMGAGDRQRLKLFRLVQRGWFPMLGDGHAYFQAAHVDDAVAAFVACVRNPAAFDEVFVVAGKDYVRLNDLVGMIGEELGVAPRIVRFPLPPAWLAAACEQVCAPIGIQPPLHRRRLNFYTNNRAFSIAKAQRLLDFIPAYSLRQTVRRTIAGYRDLGLLAPRHGPGRPP